MTNQEIKDYIRSKGVKQWEVADYMKISEPTFTRLMRKPLAPQKQLEIIHAVKIISGEEAIS